MFFFHVLNLSSIDQSFTFFSFPNKLTNVTNFFTEILTSQHPGFQVSRCGVSVRMHMIKKHFTFHKLWSPTGFFAHRFQCYNPKLMSSIWWMAKLVTKSPLFLPLICQTQISIIKFVYQYYNKKWQKPDQLEPRCTCKLIMLTLLSSLVGVSLNSCKLL